MAGKLLVCAATLPELRAFWSEASESAHSDEQFWMDIGPVVLAITGVGIPCTLLRLPALLERIKPERILNLGIAGAYPNSGLVIGDVTMADSESFGDIGFELPHAPGFQPVAEASFGRFYRKLPMALFSDFRATDPAYHLHIVNGCTVNTCTGTLETGRRRESMFGAGIESMEGAAVALAGLTAGIPVCEVRAISNLAATRDMRPESIRLALEHLADYLQACQTSV